MKYNKFVKCKSMILIGVLVFLAGCSTITSDSTAIPATQDSDSNQVLSGETITLGIISDDPIEKIEELQPLANFLAANLADSNIVDVDIKVVSTFQEMIIMMSSGAVDIFFESPYGAAIVADASGGQIALRRWKKGVEEYHSVIFSSVDSGIANLSDATGHIIAFEGIDSTSSFVLPSIYLYDEGFSLIEVQSASTDVDSESIGYLFSSDDDNTIQWVISGRVPLGAINNLAFNDLSSDDQAALVVLGETENVPRHIVVFAPGLDSDQQAAVTAVLTSAHESEAGEEALQIFGKTSRFDEFPEGIEAAASQMSLMVETMSNIQGQ